MAQQTEHLEQSRFFAVLRRMEESDPRVKGAFAIPNGFLDTKSKRIRAWQEGVASGVPDVFIPWPSKGHHGLFLEFKKAGGRVTKAQEEYLALLEHRGYKAQVVFGLRQALEALKDYLAAPWPLGSGHTPHTPPAPPAPSVPSAPLKPPGWPLAQEQPSTQPTPAPQGNNWPMSLPEPFKRKGQK